MYFLTLSLLSSAFGISSPTHQEAIEIVNNFRGSEAAKKRMAKAFGLNPEEVNLKADAGMMPQLDLAPVLHHIESDAEEKVALFVKDVTKASKAMNAVEAGVSDTLKQVLAMQSFLMESKQFPQTDSFLCQSVELLSQVASRTVDLKSHLNKAEQAVSSENPEAKVHADLPLTIFNLEQAAVGHQGHALAAQVSALAATTGMIAPVLAQELAARGGIEEVEERRQEDRKLEKLVKGLTELLHVINEEVDQVLVKILRMEKDMLELRRGQNDPDSFMEE